MWRGLRSHAATRNYARDSGIDEGYEGIFEVMPAVRPTFETIDSLGALRAEDEQRDADPLDAMIVAIATMLDKSRGEPSPAWHRILYIVTRAGQRMNTADIEMVKSRLEHGKVELHVLGVDFPPSMEPGKLSKQVDTVEVRY